MPVTSPIKISAAVSWRPSLPLAEDADLARAVLVTPGPARGEPSPDLPRKIMSVGMGEPVGAATEAARDDFNEPVQAQMQQMIWGHPRAKNYYKNSKGRVIADPDGHRIQISRPFG